MHEESYSGTACISAGGDESQISMMVAPFPTDAQHRAQCPWVERYDARVDISRPVWKINLAAPASLEQGFTVENRQISLGIPVA